VHHTWLPPQTAARLRAHVEALYGPDRADPVVAALLELMAGHLAAGGGGPGSEPFDETDVVLITYGDQVTEPGRAPLGTLADFLEQHVQGVITGLHVLPFYPWTSDDGFAVVDYGRVDPALGEWGDIERLGRRFRLMVDAVFNHVSASCPWFSGWLGGDPRYDGFFLCPPPGADLSAVVRPRTTSLLTPFETPRGVRRVWTTFSADQVDLDFSTPKVLLDVTRQLLAYVAHGAEIIRLDAVAFLWKRVGTPSIHLRETHEVIRLWRTVLETVAPGTLLVTETNVPHAENVSYFGDGTNEAHLVYQFPLAPLVLSAFLLADAQVLQEWAATLTTPSPTTTFLNFLSSHDGVGVRPAEGLLTPAEIAQLGDLARAHGGGISSRVTREGRLAPYELNTSYFEALTPADSREPLRVQVDRFLAAHSILLALAGVPAIYVHSLLGSGNWQEGVERTGRLRTINRQKFDRRALERELSDIGSRRHQVLTRLRRHIAVRTSEPAFHPNGAQRILDTQPQLSALERTAVDGSSTVVCVANLAGRPQRFVRDGLSVRGRVVDLLSGAEHDVGGGVADISLDSYGVRWLRGSSGGDAGR